MSHGLSVEPNLERRIAKNHVDRAVGNPFHSLKAILFVNLIRHQGHHLLSNQLTELLFGYIIFDKKDFVMNFNLNLRLVDEIVYYVQKCLLDRVILFGSRARGDHRERSDIDLAVSGGDINLFRYWLDESAPTLLKFDVVDLSRPLNDELLKSIRKDGVIIYDKAR